jgi:hypothetical protein
MKGLEGLGHVLQMAILVAGVATGQAANAAPFAELVVRGANVLTMDMEQPRAQAFAIADGKFLAAGSNESVGRFINARTRVLDLTGKTVVPGFIDAHAHPGPEYPEESPWNSVDCRPEKLRTIGALVAALKSKAERTPMGQWVIGSRYQETKLGRHPTRWDLDREHQSSDHHLAFERT